MALVTRYFRHNLGTGYTGLAGSLTSSLEDNAGAALTPSAVTIAESPAGSGVYRVKVDGFDEGWSGAEILSDGAGLYDVVEFSATAAGTPTIAAPPATRRLTFTYESAGVLTDVTGTPLLSDPTGAFGARRQDTGAVVVTDATAYVRESAGSYYYEIPENGYTLEYWAEYVVGGATRRQQFYSFPPLSSYATRAQLEEEYGADNVEMYANLQAESPTAALTAAEITAKVDRALTFADDFINSRLRAADYAVPLVATTGGTLPTGLLNTIALALAVWRLYRGRGKGDGDAVGDKFQEDYAWAVAELDALILAGLPGVTLEETDATPPAGTWQSVRIDFGETCAADEFAA